MAVDIRKVFYSYNSLCPEPYTLSAFVMRDGQTVLNFVESYENKEKFDAKIEEVVPLLKDLEQ